MAGLRALRAGVGLRLQRVGSRLVEEWRGGRWADVGFWARLAMLAWETCDVRAAPIKEESSSLGTSVAEMVLPASAQGLTELMSGL